MGFEAGKLAEDEKKKKEKTDKQKKQESEKILEQEKRKKEAREKKEDTDILHRLEEMLEDGVLSQDEIKELKQIVDKADVSEEQIEEILEKISEIEDVEDVDKYLPSEFRISGEEYKKSLTDDIARIQTLTKLGSGLSLLSNQINSDSGVGMNLFSGYMVILDKKLVKIQENTIDIKTNLQKVENKKYPPKKLSFLEKIKEFFKDLFN